MDKPVNIIAIILILLLSGCTSIIQSDWEKAQILDTESSYKDFLSKHPKGTFSKKAKNEIEKIDWQKTEKSNSIDAYKVFLKKYPRGSFRKQAQNILTELKWIKVQNDNSINAYLEFIRDYPENIHKSQANKWINTLIASCSPVSKRKLNSTIKEITERILPFKLTDLYDKLMTTSMSLSRGQQFGMKNTYEKGTKISVFRTQSHTLVQKSRTRQENGFELEVTLQAIPEAGVVDVFHKKTGKPKSENKQLRILYPGYTQSNKFMFSEVNIKNHKGVSQPVHYICRNNKCCDYDLLTP